MALQTIDVDQHLFESRTTWSDHIDPTRRADALSISDDAAGWPWLTWRGQHLTPLEVPIPERSTLIGEDRQRRLRGERAPAPFEELVPDSYRLAGPRLASLDEFGVDAAVMFPNYGLLWEQRLASDRDAQRANARAYNRFMADVCGDGAGRLFGVAHVLLHDPDWAVEEIRRVRAQGVRLAMIAPAPVDGKPLSHPDFDPVWAAFSAEGVAPVFHVSEFESPIHPAWRQGEQEDGEQLFDSIFLYLAPAVALANLDPARRARTVPRPAHRRRRADGELGAELPPAHRRSVGLLHPASRGALPALAERPSDYFLRQVRVAALPYEMPNRLVPKVGDETFMLGSDWPHAEGVADPMAAAQRAVAGLADPARRNILGANAAWLLGL